MNISIGSISARISVRSYDPRPIEPAEAAEIRKAMADCGPGPFGGKPRFLFVSTEESGLAGEGVGSEAVKVGTYGFIRGAPAFILGAVAKGPFANEDFGYCLEGIVLRAAELGLGTCWLGGALRRGQVADLVALRGDEMIPCITPIGHPAEKRSLMDRIVRTGAKGDNRKPASALFFDNGFDRPLADAGAYESVLEAVRRGPSASNKQPWRLVRSGSSSSPVFHLYLDEDKPYNSALGEAKMQNVDMGIAMRHFEVAARAQGLLGAWSRLDSAPLGRKGSLLYIASWK